MFSTLQHIRIICHNEQVIKTVGWNKPLRKTSMKTKLALPCNKIKAFTVHKSELKTIPSFIDTDDLVVHANAKKAQATWWRWR